MSVNEILDGRHLDDWRIQGNGRGENGNFALITDHYRDFTRDVMHLDGNVTMGDAFVAADVEATAEEFRRSCQE